MTTKLYGRDLKEYEDIDFDSLLEQLTEAELEELNNECDPDNTLLPASERSRDQTDKKPTGPFDRAALMQFLREKASQEADWKDVVPYQKLNRGNRFIAQPPEQRLSREQLAELGLDADLEEALNNATEEELVDLAAILGFTGILNQTQYWDGITDKGQHCGGFDGVARGQRLPTIAALPENDTNVEEALRDLAANTLETLNLNNMKRISDEHIRQVFEALQDNTSLRKLMCSNTQLHDKHLKPLIDALCVNKNLEELNVESNFLSGDYIVQLLRAVNESQTLRQLSVSNQRQLTLGQKVEQELISLVLANESLVRFSVDLYTADARIRVRDRIQRNFDEIVRKKRVQKQ